MSISKPIVLVNDSEDEDGAGYCTESDSAGEEIGRELYMEKLERQLERIKRANKNEEMIKKTLGAKYVEDDFKKE